VGPFQLGGKLPFDKLRANEEACPFALSREPVERSKGEFAPNLKYARRQFHNFCHRSTIAQAMGLDFVPLTAERYDLVMRRETWETPAVQALAAWLTSADARAMLESLGGYETQETGRVQWLAT
jgi:hypothetical protein